MTTTTSSPGHALSAAGRLDTRYLAGQPDYEAMLRAAHFQAGFAQVNRLSDRWLAAVKST